MTNKTKTKMMRKVYYWRNESPGEIKVAFFEDVFGMNLFVEVLENSNDMGGRRNNYVWKVEIEN